MRLWCETVLPSEREPISKPTENKSDIVFLHGTGSNAHMWKNQLAYFSRLGHTCTLIDLRGHGKSHEHYEKTDLEVHRQDVLETLQNSNVKFPAYFIGHSLGGIVALAIAQKHPEMVKGIFAACVPPKLIKPVQLFLLLFLNGPMQALNKSPIKKYLPWREQTLLEMPIFTMKEIANFFAASNLLEKSPEVNCPVHISAARFDPIAIHWHAKQLHRRMPASTFKTFEWAGHNVMDYRIDEFNHWILSHLN